MPVVLMADASHAVHLHPKASRRVVQRVLLLPLYRHVRENQKTLVVMIAALFTRKMYLQ